MKFLTLAFCIAFISPLYCQGIGFPGIEVSMLMVEYQAGTNNKTIWTNDKTWGDANDFKAYRLVKPPGPSDWTLSNDYLQAKNGCVCVRKEP